MVSFKTGIMIFLVVAVIAVGYVVFAHKTSAPTVSPSPTMSTTISPTVSTVPTSKPTHTPWHIGSGAYGTITTGPTCPIQRNPPDPTCADRPYFGTVTPCRADLMSSCTDTYRFTTDKDGHYSVSLSPGAYYFVAEVGFRGSRSQNIVVKANAYTQTDIVFDTGIR